MSVQKNFLKFNKTNFQEFLKGLGDVNDSTILHVKSDTMYSISSSEDRSMFLYSSLEVDSDVDIVLNLPSLQKLSKSLSLIPEENIKLLINNNNLEYNSDNLKFKYHIYGDGILVAPKITLNKIDNLTYEYEFNVSKNFIKEILKNSSIFKDTNKLYIYTESDRMIWSLSDKTQPNKDHLIIKGDVVDFVMDEFIINLDNLRLIDISKTDILKFKINKLGIGNILIENGNLKLNYILSSLTT